MKRMIKLLPILFALPLLGLFPNSQRIEKAEALDISSGEQYYIMNEAKTYGFERNGTHGIKTTGSATMNTVYSFTYNDVDAYTIRVYDTDQMLCYAENNYLLKYYTPSGLPASGYGTEWILFDTGEHVYLKAKTGNNYYITLHDGNWEAYQTVTSDCYLSIFTAGEDSAPFVTAMNNIACTDLIGGPAVDGDNSWASAATAFSGLKQPTKDYLKDLEADKTYGTINTPERAVAKYDYIVNKYNKGGVVYTEFITGRSASGLVNIDNTSFSSSVTNTPIIIVISFITVLSFSSILILKKKR